jgi:hypothetical protein
LKALLKNIAILIFLLFANNIVAQNKYDQQWLIGFYPSFLDFQNAATFSPLKANFLNFPYGFIASAYSSICNPITGDFAITTNCNKIFTDSITIMKNGDSMLSPKMFNKWKSGYFPQQSIIIPKNDNEYYVVINGLSDTMLDTYVNGKGMAIDELMYSIVDMTKENGKGEVVKKRITLIQNPKLANWQTTACRHGNGRDWWLVKNHINKDEFYTWRFTADGIYGPYVQTLQNDSVHPFSNIGQGEFNKDASMYAQCGEYYHKVQLNYFDRCSGQFTRWKVINVPLDSLYQENNPTGLSFSASGRFLYVCTNFSLWQYDLQEQDESKAWYYIAGHDTIPSNSNFYWYCQLKRGSNDKIYVGSWNGTLPPFLTFIDAPDEKGAACSLCKRCLNPNNFSTNGLPNMFNYRLGAWENSICDTIRNTHPDWLLYPNPAFNNLNLDVPNSKQGSTIVIEIFNMLGQLIEKKEYKINIDYQVEISLGSYSRGIYFLKATYGNDKFISRFLKE